MAHYSRGERSTACRAAVRRAGRVDRAGSQARASDDREVAGCQGKAGRDPGEDRGRLRAGAVDVVHQVAGCHVVDDAVVCNAIFGGNLQDTLAALCQSRPDVCLGAGVDPWAPQDLAGYLRPLVPSVDALDDHCV